MRNVSSESSASSAVERDIQMTSGVLSLHVRKRFDATKTSFELDVAANVSSGVTIIFGPSGAGKTTLLECIAGLLRPGSGQIAIADRILFDSSRKVFVEPRQRRIGYVFQDLALFPHLTVEKNVGYGIRGLAVGDRERKIADVLESFRIANLRHRKPGEISGGERQRVALARSLVTDPCVLLLDEPLAALDATTKAKLIDDLRCWNEAHGIPILYVTHSREEVFALGDRVLMLDAGKIIAEGTPDAVMRR